MDVAVIGIANSRAASDPHTASLTMTKLQNPIREGFDAVTEDLRKVSKVQKDFGRSLDKVGRPQASSLIRTNG